MTNPSKTVTNEQLDALRAKFASMPKKAQTKFSARKTVEALAEQIRRMVDKDGYSFEDVASLLHQDGVQLTPSTIRTYLRSFEAKKEETPPNTRKAKPMPSTEAPTSPKPVQVPQHLSNALPYYDDKADAELIRMVATAQMNHG
ncbi:MAG: hypothetical protein CFE33_18365 [Pseudorhodobacter sp. PARRP1]|nr:MAG: hypothetical protein CFE33_18365 [Pseudorhodobacter sp. PARRP1]